MNKRLTLTGVNVFFFIFCAVFIVYQMILGVILLDKLSDNLYIIILINEFVMILGSVAIFCVVKKVNIKETFRINKPGIVPMLLIAAISVPAYFVAAMLNNIILYILQFIGDIPAQSIPVPQNLTELLIGILIIAVSPGICEEVMHRGLLLRAYEKRGSYKAVVFVSIYFGIFHFDITNLLGPIFLGLIIGYYVIRTNSIFAGIFAHFINNTIAEVLQYLYRNQPTPDKITVSWYDLKFIIMLGIAGLGITMGLLLLFKRATIGRAAIIPPIDTVRRDTKAILSHWPVILVLLMYFFMMLIYILSIVSLKYFPMQ